MKNNAKPKAAGASWFRRTLFLLSAPSCVSCGGILKSGETALCGECYAKYLDAKGRNCSLCANPLSRCRCTGKLLEENAVHTLIKVYRYRPQEDFLPSNDLIYALKRRNRADVFSFLADELCDAIRAGVEDLGSYALTYVPRRRGGVTDHGYDHARELAKAVGARLSVPVIPTLRSCAKYEQKKRTVAERVENAKYKVLRRRSPLPQKMLLLDDIVTSGASMSACAHELRKAGVKQIVGVAVAIAYRDHDAVRHNKKQ